MTQEIVWLCFMCEAEGIGKQTGIAHTEQNPGHGVFGMLAETPIN